MDVVMIKNSDNWDKMDGIAGNSRVWQPLKPSHKW